MSPFWLRDGIEKVFSSGVPACPLTVTTTPLAGSALGMKWISPWA
jgi:hypothetical protein